MQQVVEKIIVLKSVKHSESDLIVHGLSPKGSKLHLFAKAALKSKKRFGGGLLEPTHYIKAILKLKPDGLHQIIEASSIYAFEKLRADYDRLSLGLEFVQCIDRCSFEGLQDAENVFDLLGNSLKAAEVSNDLDKLKLHFFVKLLNSQGVLPECFHNTDVLAVPITKHERLVIPASSLKIYQREIKNSLEQLL